MKAKFQKIQHQLAELFDPGQWQSFSRILKQVFPLLPQYWSQTEGLEVEPDGYDGIQRSGLLDALLPTDLALAKLLPHEFLRRYNMSELNYLKRHYTPIHNGGRCLVLLNIGPLYWGSPKLVQLALLIGLYLRCQQLNVDLTWSPAHLWRPKQGLEIDGLNEFLDESTYQPPQLEGFEQKLWGFDEVWSVGFNPAHARVWRIDIQEEEKEVLSLRISRKGHMQRKRDLSLPAPEIQVGILRRPQTIAPPASMAQPHGIALPFIPAFVQISPNGNRILLKKGRDLAWAPLGSSSKMKIRWRRTTLPEGSLVSLGFWKNALRFVTFKDELLTNHHPPFQLRVPGPKDPQLETLPWAASDEGVPKKFFFKLIGKIGVLDSMTAPSIKRLQDPPFAYSLDKSPFWLAKRENHYVALYREDCFIREVPTLAGVEHVFFFGLNGTWAMAYERDKYWHVGMEDQVPQKVRIPPNTRVLGICLGLGLQLVWLENDLQTVGVLRGNLVIRCPKLPGEFLAYDMNPIKGLLAIITKNHHLVIYNLKTMSQGKDQVFVQIEGSYRG